MRAGHQSIPFSLFFNTLYEEVLEFRVTREYSLHQYFVLILLLEYILRVLRTPIGNEKGASWDYGNCEITE